MLISVVLGLTLSKYGKDFSVVLILLVSCMVLAVMTAYLEPIIDFIGELLRLGEIQNDLLKPVIKATGIGIVAEIASLICGDSGNAALGKCIQILAATVILWISLPLMRSLLELMQRMLGNI
ncbi:MAG: hypothetical protein J6Q30_03510 [Oscillospiraceae bacterium]|nr:hypothetical protein [Oscillospiraceae bacterium]